MTAPAWSALATFAAVIVALSIALWQHRAQLRAMAGVQREKAAYIAITARDAHFVEIKNFGPAPFYRVRVHEARADLQQAPGPASEMPVIGKASARANPEAGWVVGPDETVRFRLLNWVDDADLAPLSPEQVESLQQPDVTWRYRDVVGTRWERIDNDRPEPTGGGTPLPGVVDIRDRCTYWWRRYRGWMREVERRRDDRLAREREGRGA